jgi:hypothetical protein
MDPADAVNMSRLGEPLALTSVTAENPPFLLKRERQAPRDAEQVLRQKNP